MTLKQKLFLKKLPKNNYNVYKTAKEAGYSDVSAKSTIYTQLKNSKKLQEKLDICNPEKIKKDINYVYKLAKKKEDITNLNRNIELRSKIAGMVIDKAEVTQVDKENNQFSLDRLSRIKQSEN